MWYLIIVDHDVIISVMFKLQVGAVGVGVIGASWWSMTTHRRTRRQYRTHHAGTLTWYARLPRNIYVIFYKIWIGVKTERV